MKMLGVLSKYLAPAIQQSKMMNGWKDLPISECGESLVPIGPFTNYSTGIYTDSIYAGTRVTSPYRGSDKLNGALIGVYVRKGVANKLGLVASILPSGYALLVWDAYRPIEVQESLFNRIVSKIVDEGVDYEQAKIDVQKFCSIPSINPKCPPPHNTGGAIDLSIIKVDRTFRSEIEYLNQTISASEDSEDVFRAEMRRIQLIRENSSLLNMGTLFDEMCGATCTSYFEQVSDNKSARYNRRMLNDFMESAGFSNYPEEWWHYDFGNQFAAIRTGEDSIYGAIHLDESCKRYEIMMQGWYSGCVSAYDGKSHPLSLGKTNHSLRGFVCSVVNATGDIQYSAHQQVCAV